MQRSFCRFCHRAAAAEVLVPWGGHDAREAEAGVLNKPWRKLVGSWLISEFFWGVEGLPRAARKPVQLPPASCACLAEEFKLTETGWLCWSYYSL